MQLRYQIEMWMTVALVLYIAAFALARWHSNWRVHVFVACLGFLGDMYATWLMLQIFGNGGSSLSASHIFLQMHVVLSVAAVCAFGIQAWLGIRIRRAKLWLDRIGKRRQHAHFAIWVFFPIWICAYLSGFAVVLR